MDSAGTMDVGSRIRALRWRRGMTLQQVGELSGLSTPFLSQVERDQVSTTVTSLAGIARALRVSLNYFVNVPDQSTSFRRADNVSYFQLDGGSEKLARLAGRFPDRQLEPMLVRIPPGGAVPRFAQAGEEFFYLLMGRLTVSVGQEKQTLGPGSLGHHSSTISHDWRNQGKAEVVRVWVGMPPLF
jgi:transcriptional regulator with XRE-family HTH domain